MMIIPQKHLKPCVLGPLRRHVLLTTDFQQMPVASDQYGIHSLAYAQVQQISITDIKEIF